MRKLEWDDVGVDGRQLHHLRFADDIVLITPSISEAGRMLAQFQRNMRKHRSLAAKDDVHAQRMGLGCSIHAQRNENIRMHQLRLSGSGIEHDAVSDWIPRDIKRITGR
ncbi:hypothetical protein RB195_011012 [Necator americanus]|uniref:Reverse transcriptase domain-containing protein n=1 Tax=Necator americanus TaxID=51031 RepID=A0ABR1D1G9_NECAM